MSERVSIQFNYCLDWELGRSDQGRRVVKPGGIGNTRLALAVSERLTGNESRLGQVDEASPFVCRHANLVHFADCGAGMFASTRASNSANEISEKSTPGTCRAAAPAASPLRFARGQRRASQKQLEEEGSNGEVESRVDDRGALPSSMRPS